MGEHVGDRVDELPLWAAALFLFLVLFIVYLPTAAHTFVGQPNDTYATVVPAAHLVAHGTLDLSGAPYADTAVWFQQIGGRVLSNRMPGVIFAAVPFYALLPTTPAIHPGPGAVAAATYTAGAMVGLFLLLRQVVGRRSALAAALVAGLATSTWAISANALWPHTMGQLWLVLAMLALASRRWLPGGLAFGMGILARPTTAIVPAVVGLASGWRRRDWRPVVLVGLGAAAGLAAYLAYNRLVLAGGGAAGEVSLVTGGYGEAWLERLVGRPPGEWAADVAGLLVAPSRGILLLSPFLLVLLAGLPQAWRRTPDWARDAAVGGLALVLLEVRMGGFDGGWGYFVYRYGLETLTLSAPLLVIAYRVAVERWRRARPAFWCLVVVSTAVQLVGAVVYRQRPLDEYPTEPEWGAEWTWLEWQQGLSDLGWAGGIALLGAVGVGCAVALWWDAATRAPEGAGAG